MTKKDYTKQIKNLRARIRLLRSDIILNNRDKNATRLLSIDIMTLKELLQSLKGM